jgi:hypothetical protein
MATALSIVRSDEDWTRTATLTATTSASGYPASNAATDDPSLPWKATSGTATLTVTLSGTKEVGMLGLVMTNADAAKTITIAGGITGSPTMTGTRDANGAPVDLYFIVDPPQNLTAVTFAISGNSVNWSVGRVVVGKRRTLGRTFHVGAYTPSRMRPQYSDENDFGHEIRYDLGIQRNGVKGKLRLNHATDLETLDNWWIASRGGFYPTFLVPNANVATRYPPMFARFASKIEFNYGAPNMAEVSLDLTEVSRGLEVVA